MAIRKPGPRLLKKFARTGRREVSSSLSLTSMIDFLVVTVVFLLMSFSASGEPALQRNLHLPTADNVIDTADAPLVAVAGGQILLDGAAAGVTRQVDETKRLQRIDELHTALAAKRDLWKQINPGKTFPGVVLLEIDQDVSSIVVKSIFQTAAFAGYPNVSFMVQKR